MCRRRPTRGVLGTEIAPAVESEAVALKCDTPHSRRRSLVSPIGLLSRQLRRSPPDREWQCSSGTGKTCRRGGLRSHGSSGRHNESTSPATTRMTTIAAVTATLSAGALAELLATRVLPHVGTGLNTPSTCPDARRPSRVATSTVPLRRVEGSAHKREQIIEFNAASPSVTNKIVDC